MFSPDGRWLAYTSMEAGQREVVVESFDPGGRNEQQAKRWQLSNDGGELPRWRRDGRELFYLSPKDGHVQSVQIRNTGAGIEPQAPTTLFSVSLTQTLQPDFDVSADGQRFLLQVTAPEAQSTPATVVMNWAGLLKP